MQAVDNMTAKLGATSGGIYALDIRVAARRCNVLLVLVMLACCSMPAATLG